MGFHVHAKVTITKGSAGYSRRMPLVRASKRPFFDRIFTAVGIFCFFAMIMALYAAITLLHPGTVLDGLWSLNPDAHRQLVLFRKPAGALLLVVAAVAVITGIGWFRRRLWGWRLAVVGISTQIVGDCVNLIRGDFLRGGAGVLIGAALLLLLLSNKVKKNFNPAGETG